MSTKQALVQSALSLFLERGYETVTMDDIAKHTQTTKGALYHYFDTKYEVYKEAILYAIDSYGQELELKFNDPGRTLHRIMLELTGRLSNGKSASDLQHQVLSFALFFDAAKRFPELREAIASIYQKLLALITKRLDQDKAAEIFSEQASSEWIALRVLAQLEGIAILQSLGQKTVTAEEAESLLYYALGYKNG